MERFEGYDNPALVSVSMPTIATFGTIENVEPSGGQYPDVEEDPKETSRRSSKGDTSSDQRIYPGVNGTGDPASNNGK